LTIGPELAGKLAVDVPFLMQQAHILYERQLEELHVQMQRVNSSTSVLGQSKGTPPIQWTANIDHSGESSRGSGQLEPGILRTVPTTPSTIRATPSPLGHIRASRISSTISLT
jgi:hypothetical protein